MNSGSWFDRYERLYNEREDRGSGETDEELSEQATDEMVSDLFERAKLRTVTARQNRKQNIGEKK